MGPPLLRLGVWGGQAWLTRRPHASVHLQLFWEKKLSGLNAFDIAEELVQTMDLPKGLQGERRRRGGQGSVQGEGAPHLR